MNTTKTLIAACVATLLGSSLAQAAGFNEEDWKKTRSYGNVTVAEDSVDQWGPWSAFVEPAAGGPTINPLAFIGGGNSAPYRTLPEVISNDNFCGTGNWCGYAIYSSNSDSPKRALVSEEGPSSNYAAGEFAMTLTPTPREELPAFAKFMFDEGGEGYAPDYPGTASWKLRTLDGTTEVASSGPLNAYFGGGSYNLAEYGQRLVWIPGRGFRWVPYQIVGEGQRYDNRDDGLHHFDAWGSGENGYAFASGFSHNRKADEASSYIPDTSMVVGYVPVPTRHGWDWYPIVKKVSPFTDAIRYSDENVAVGRIAAYTYGGGGESEMERRPMMNGIEGYYVAGLETSQEQLSALRANNITASYLGGSYDGNRQGYVAMQVKFGDATWNGSWYGGHDAQAMNFNASGTISGSKISSNNISASQFNQNGTSYQGSVNGRIYGSDAASIGGVSSVQKVVSEQVVQTQNALFLVNKVAPVVTPSQTGNK